MQFDNDKICKTFKVPAEVIDTIDDQHESRAGKTFTFLVNNAPLGFLKAKNAVAADYLSFLDGAVKAMLCDTESLEKKRICQEKPLNMPTLKLLERYLLEKKMSNPKCFAWQLMAN